MNQRDTAERLALIAAAAIPLLSSIGVAIAQAMKSRRGGLLLARLGMAAGAASGIILATLLNGQNGEPRSVPVIFGKWFSFSLPQAVSITFGLEADLIKAGLFGLTGILALIALWKANSSKEPFSDDLILTNSLLYAAGAFFVFAPNLAQSLMGWGAIGTLVSMTIQLSNRRTELTGKQVVSGFDRANSIRQAEPRGREGPSTVDSVVQLLEWSCHQSIQRLIRIFPNWLSDQTEVVGDSPVTIQLLAAILGTSAILLTWLFMPVG